MNVELKVKDTTSYEPHIVVCDQFRCYVFLRGGKLEHEFHLLHLKSIHSISKTEVTLSWQLPSANKITSVTIHPVCYASSTVDTIVLWLLQHWRQNFVGTPDSERFTVELGPPHRSEALLKLDFIEDKEKDCGGYLYTYLAWNDYLNADPSPRIIWELKHYFYEQVVKVFDLEEFVLKDKFPNLEFETCASALQHNTWFTTLRSSGITLGNDSVGLLVDIFKRNKTIHTLILEDGGVTPRLGPTFASCI